MQDRLSSLSRYLGLTNLILRLKAIVVGLQGILITTAAVLIINIPI